MAQSFASEFKTGRERAETLAEKASDVADQAKQTASEYASAAAEHGAKAVKDIERGAITAYASTKRFVEEQPMLALAGAAAVCFAAGAIWKLSQREKRVTGLSFVDRLANSVEPQYRDLKRRYL